MRSHPIEGASLNAIGSLPLIIVRRHGAARSSAIALICLARTPLGPAVFNLEQIRRLIVVTHMNDGELIPFVCTRGPALRIARLERVEKSVTHESASRTSDSKLLIFLKVGGISCR
jgi:hypothetical protein